jgi:hypothetical protein
VCLLCGTDWVFVCFVWIWEQTAIISLYSINWLVCITETESVYFTVRTDCLYIIYIKRSLPNSEGQTEVSGWNVRCSAIRLGVTKLVFTQYYCRYCRGNVLLNRYWQVQNWQRYSMLHQQILTGAELTALQYATSTDIVHKFAHHLYHFPSGKPFWRKQDFSFL